MIAVTPGEKLPIFVGGAGVRDKGGFNGGADGGNVKACRGGRGAGGSGGEGDGYNGGLPGTGGTQDPGGSGDGGAGTAGSGGSGSNGSLGRGGADGAVGRTPSATGLSLAENGRRPDRLPGSPQAVDAAGSEE